MGLLGRGKTAEQPAMEKQHHDAHPLGDDDTGKIVNNTVRAPYIGVILHMTQPGSSPAPITLLPIAPPRVAYPLSNAKSITRGCACCRKFITRRASFFLFPASC